MSLGIPKRLGHIWIGDRPPPLEWMNTWKSHHPDWDYVVYDNAFLTSRTWRNQALIIEYFRRRSFEGVADLMRYEILHEQGGFIAPADAECLRNCDELFVQPATYTVYENEVRKPGLVSPILASVPGADFLDYLIADLGQRWSPETLKIPWRSTGNRYLKFRIEEQKPDLIIFPSHYFIPEHKSGLVHTGDGPVYAREYWGTTRSAYTESDPDSARAIFSETLAALERASSV